MQKTIQRITTLRLLMSSLVVTLISVAASAQERTPGSVFNDCDICPQMVVLPAGEFVQGSDKVESGHLDEKPQRTVKLSRPFAVAKTETTFAQWDACVADGKCPKADDAGLGRGKFPAVNNSWPEAKSYVTWPSAKTGKSYRLLNESEFEYAVRGGTKTAWFWGGNDDKKKTCDYANLHDEKGKEAHPNYVWSHVLCNDGAAENAEVGQYKPNPFGLHDMLGNIREWVEDCHQAGYAGAPEDGSARKHEGKCEKRVVRGGAWLDGPSTARSAYRYSEEEGMRNHQTGFRVARDL
ncbi:MAG: formylglycine-generating enzyme family protein [Oxalobacteraceae bacterium]